jgi:hypothetical protein
LAAAKYATEGGGDRKAEKSESQKSQDETNKDLTPSRQVDAIENTNNSAAEKFDTSPMTVKRVQRLPG